MNARAPNDEGSFAPHFCKGRFSVAFVFSAPGTAELAAGKPVAGATGSNLELALSYLHGALPAVFPSSRRYDYRITNVFSEPIAIALGHQSSEAHAADVRDARNVQRVLRELEGCQLSVLSGKKAGLLSRVIAGLGLEVVKVPHIGNKGLNNSFSVPDDLGVTSSSAGRRPGSTLGRCRS
jgi:hypothetical protein